MCFSSSLQMVTRTKKIFVGGLSAPSTLEDVKNYFEQFGRVSSLMIISSCSTGPPGAMLRRWYGGLPISPKDQVQLYYLVCVSQQAATAVSVCVVYVCVHDFAKDLRGISKRCSFLAAVCTLS